MDAAEEMWEKFIDHLHLVQPIGWQNRGLRVVQNQACEMSTFQGNEPFLSHCYRTGFLAQCDDFRDWWSMWCMGAMSNEL